MTPILLDTCAALWLANGSPLADGVVEALQACDGIHISPASAWELGQLTSRRRLSLSMDTSGWWDALVEAGADVVFGHSAHIFRGVEVHRRVSC